MPLTVVQSATGQLTAQPVGTALTLTLPAAPTAGSLLVLAWTASPATADNTTDFAGSGPHVAELTATAGDGRTYLSTKQAGAAEPSSATVTVAVANQDLAAVLLEVSGVDTTATEGTVETGAPVVNAGAVYSVDAAAQAALGTANGEVAVLVMGGRGITTALETFAGKASRPGGSSYTFTDGVLNAGSVNLLSNSQHTFTDADTGGTVTDTAGAIAPGTTLTGPVVYDTRMDYMSQAALATATGDTVTVTLPLVTPYATPVAAQTPPSGAQAVAVAVAVAPVATSDADTGDSQMSWGYPTDSANTMLVQVPAASAAPPVPVSMQLDIVQGSTAFDDLPLAGALVMRLGAVAGSTRSAQVQVPDMSDTLPIGMALGLQADCYLEPPESADDVEGDI